MAESEIEREGKRERNMRNFESQVKMLQVNL